MTSSAQHSSVLEKDSNMHTPVHGSSEEIDKDVEKDAADVIPQEPQPAHLQNSQYPQTTPSQPAKEENTGLVEFDGPDDPENPKNWSKKKRWTVTCSMGLMTFVVTFASSVFASAAETVAAEYHIGDVTAILGVSLFLLVSTTPDTTSFRD